ncbi:hypothetical protein SMC6_07775 [Candidatus Cryosericum odellii]|jgi:glucose-1-phosphate thymidylyltransferase|uniref:glucose-1-phosphate thymidylyltransferase n=1 Tax=Candidatus Cryosericum odellii TaxID=2290917 RepID=A0A398CUK1_9BACT|nr:sugar phosphate nucleotidyltransferase [Candidatus Cryosericum odellii]RIE07066.1 hypothetical protein SMC6_07775 [Candidatus Cryosericum odellii]RIE13625.1 hypothetical protein SMC5_02770 [Candidatus Cryosericum odellii]
MKGIVLSGSTGLRVPPLTAVTNKVLLPMGQYLTVFQSTERLKQAGIRDVLVVTGRDYMGDVIELPGSGHNFGFTYKVQDAQHLGVG